MQTKYNLLPVIILTLWLPVAANAQYAYDITPLGGTPLSLNNQGQVVGYYSAQGNQYRSFEYSNGQTQDLFPNDPKGSVAYAINDRGQIAGKSGSPFFYDSTTGVRTSLGLTQYDYANSINQNGDVAGTYIKGGFLGGPTDAFIYSSSTGKLQDISQPSSGGYKTATDINNSGQVTGTTFFLNQEHAYRYTNGVTQDLGSIPSYTSSQGTGINDSGEVIGYADAGGNTPTHAFLYRNGAMNDLGVLINPQVDSFADGINNLGDVVGEAGNTGFLYHNGAAHYLNDLIDPSLGWNTLQGTAINDAGQIIGMGSFGGFIMTPHAAATPAPGSLLTFGAGIGAALLAARRRKRNAAAR